MTKLSKDQLDDDALHPIPIRRVRAATTANITLSGTQTIDGVSIVAGNRVLVKSQSTASQNGIYVCAAGAWTRAVDFSITAAEVSPMLVLISEGTVCSNSLWILTTNEPFTIGTTSLAFELVQQTAGSGGGSATQAQVLTIAGLRA